MYSQICICNMHKAQRGYNQASHSCPLRRSPVGASCFVWLVYCSLYDQDRILFLVLSTDALVFPIQPGTVIGGTSKTLNKALRFACQLCGISTGNEFSQAAQCSQVANFSHVAKFSQPAHFFTAERIFFPAAHFFTAAQFLHSSAISSQRAISRLLINCLHREIQLSRLREQLQDTSNNTNFFGHRTPV
jgi:hypothetical protein